MQTMPELLEFLKDHDACAESLEWLADYPTPAAALAACSRTDWLEGLCVEAGVAYAPARADYEKARAQAGAIFVCIDGPAYRKYSMATAHNLAVYDATRGKARTQAQAVYNEACAPAWVEYQAETAPARAAFAEARAQACATYHEALRGLLRTHFGL